MESSKLDPEGLLQMKIDNLQKHTSFIRKIIAAVTIQTTKAKWIGILRNIEDPTKVLSKSLIDEILSNINRLKTAVEKRRQNGQLETRPKLSEVPTNVPNTTASSKPVLSIRDVEELINDLSSSEPSHRRKSSDSSLSRNAAKATDNSESDTNSEGESHCLPAEKLTSALRSRQLKIRSKTAELKLKNNIKKHQNHTGIRRVVIPNALKTSFSMPSKYGKNFSTSLSGFKIPKIANSTSPLHQKIESAVNKQIDIFKTIEENANSVNPTLWKTNNGSSSTSTCSAQDISAVEIADAVRKKQVQDSKTPNLPDSTDIELKKNPMTSSAADVDKNSETKSTVTEVSQEHLDFRVNKELKRLQENIVKDVSPLPSRRSCTIKRAGRSFGVKPTFDDDADSQDKPSAKKAKPEAAEQSQGGKVLSPAQAGRSPNEDPPSSVYRPVRTTRRSAAFAEKVSTSFDLKPCSIKLPPVDLNPIKIKQVAMKSTSQLSIRPPKSLSSSKIYKRKLNNTSDTSSDDELSNSTVKKVFNIEIMKSNIGFIYRCLIARDTIVCSFQSLHKHSFVNHLEKQHSSVKWNGHCKSCNTMVLSEDIEGHSLMNEFLHLEDHKADDVESFKTVKRVKVDSEEVDEVTKSKQVMGDIDSILNIIDSGTSEGSEKTRPNITTVTNEAKTPPTSNFITAVETPTKISPNGAQTKTVSDIVGRVINISQLSGKNMQSILSNAKRIKMPLNTVNKPGLVRNFTNFGIARPVKPTNQVKPTTSLTASKPAVVSTQLFVTLPNPKPFIIKTITPESKSITIKNQQELDNIFKPEQVLKTVNDPLRHDEILRPWLGRRTKKNAKATKDMLSPYSLAAKFKCIGTNCRFYTISSEFFLTHISFHLQYTSEDKENFLTCAYCHFVATSGKVLIDHVNTEHGCDKFQCIYCLYRSCEAFNVITHQNCHHIMKPRKVMKLESEQFMNFRLALEEVKLSRKVNVPKIFCVCNEKSFYVFRHFKYHLDTHPLTATTFCSKCGETVNKSSIHKHLMLCYGFGLYQCVYCCFGTSSIEAIGNHLANKHPSKLTFYCQRSERLQDNTSPYQSIPHDQIEGTCLKQVKLTVKKECLLSPPKDDELMRNYSNIGKLGENLQIEGIKTIKSSNPPLETPKTYYVRDMTLKDSGQPVAAKRLSLPEKLRISMEMPKLRQIPTKSLTETILKIPSPESNASSASSFKNNSKFDNLKGSMPARTFSERTKPSQSQLSKLLTADLDTFKLDGIDVKKETISPPATSTATESPFDLQIKNVFSLTEGKSIAAADWFA